MSDLFTWSMQGGLTRGRVFLRMLHPNAWGRACVHAKGVCVGGGDKATQRAAASEWALSCYRWSERAPSLCRSGTLSLCLELLGALTGALTLPLNCGALTPPLKREGPLAPPLHSRCIDCTVQRSGALTLPFNSLGALNGSRGARASERLEQEAD